MLTSPDIALLKQKSISEDQIKEQLDFFEKGFEYLNIDTIATVNKGIMKFDACLMEQYIAKWDHYRKEDKEIIKFVPASGAASRMFKNLYEYLDAFYSEPNTTFEKKFIDDIHHFAFFSELDEYCLRNEGMDIDTLIKSGQAKCVVKNLLDLKGLNYGGLPKGVLKFHHYSDNHTRTAMEEHLVEGVKYAQMNDGKVKIHFTVSPEHLSLFTTLLKEKQDFYNQQFNAQIEVTFSEQKSSTDTIAVDMENIPFRENGNLVFRPAGHGALIENLNDLNADVIFIKNIDNVVPDKLKDVTVVYKKLLAGVLVTTRQIIFQYMNMLDNGEYTVDDLQAMTLFLENTLNVKCKKKIDSVTELTSYLRSKLDRPLRVCGMVKNQGEVGGGPFFIVNHDQTVSLQILESSQINMKNAHSVEMFENSTHFNPVDLVCAIKDYKGEKYDLTRFVDKNIGFISIKSKNGHELKALELPGLWNGAMSDWNTIFIEEPILTFNPVKIVNDLLREEHQ